MTGTPEETTGERLCAACAAPMAAGQDWCLECGNAQPGRLGGRPGWRAALTVVALTGVLATGAVAAAYAALSSEAQRQASAPPPPPAEPTVTQPPAQTAPPAEPEPPPVEAPDLGGDLPETSPPSGGFEPAPPPAPAPAPPPAPSGGGSGGAAEEEPEHKPLKLASAETFDPDERGAGRVGEAEDAIDDDEDTYWEAPVTDSKTGEVGIGLVVSLDEAKEIHAAQITSGTPGFSVTLYGAKSKKVPPDLIDTRWKKIDNTRDFGAEEEIEIDGTYRHVLLWFTEQPADFKVIIPEVELLG